MMNKRTCALATFLLLLAIWPLAPLLAGQDQSPNAAPVQSSRKGIGHLFNYLNIAGDGAVSFGITMGSNIGFSVVKEFLPDLGRALAKKNRKKPSNPPQ